MKKHFAAVLFAGALVIGCTAGEDTATDDPAGGATTTADSIAVPTGPAPGVTDDTVRVGVTYVDLASLGEVVSIDHGDYEAAYQALFDDINASGGIHGRMIEPVIVPVSPVGSEGAEAACVQLTEDEPVFIVVGFFLDDAVLCPLEAHQTAVIGSTMSAERLARAEAPWFTAEGSTDLQSDIVRAFADEGEFDGTLGVYAGPGEEAQLDDVVLPLLEELGIEVAESAVADASSANAGDITAANAAVAVIAERFESSGVDQVLILGSAGLGWASGTQGLDYRPQLFLTDPNAVLAFAGDTAGNDLSVLDDAVAGSLYGPDERIYDLEAMQECAAVIEAAGGEVPDPATAPEDGGFFVSAFAACDDVALLRALLEAAGEDLNYGTLAAGADGLEVQLPGEPDTRTYGAPPAGDGDPTPYLFDWDPDVVDFVLREG